MKIQFRGEMYQLVFTDHAELRMKQRAVSIDEAVDVLASGKIKPKDKENAFWVYKSLRGRKDNLVCFSVSLEDPFLIVITTLVKWRPE